jgi:hypothetical protein
MGYIPGFAHDVFISYAQVDDLQDLDDEDGWVTALVKKLNNRLAQLLGRQDGFSVWIDRSGLPRNVDITPEIQGILASTATMIVILSPGYLASEWCRREREAFLKLGQGRQREEGRIFLVERDKVDLEARPKEFSDLLGYRFWVQDRPGRSPRILGMPRGSHGEDAYVDALNDLAWDLSSKLKTLKASPSPQPQPQPIRPPQPQPQPQAVPAAPTAKSGTTIFLAEVTDDLDLSRSKVIRNLQQFGLRVVPEVWYPREAEAFRQAVEEGLAQADLFVQLLSAAPGRKPPGLEGGYVGFQHEKAQQLGMPILQWRSPSLGDKEVQDGVEDEGHRQLLLGPNVQAVDLEIFGREVVRRAQQAKRETEAAPPREAFVFVDLCPQDESGSADALCRELEKRGIGYALPVNSGQAEDIRMDLEANFLECDGMIVVYGRVPNTWVRGQIREFRKLTYKREKKANALAVYHAPPTPKEPLGIKLPNLTTIDGTAALGEVLFQGFFDALFGGPAA